MSPIPKVKNEHMGLAIASLVLGGISLIGFWLYGMPIILAIIGLIFGLICMIKGQKSVRVMGIVGFIVSLLAILACLIVWYMIYSVINWDNMTWEALQSINSVDQTNQQEMLEWMQQFLKIDISSFNM